MAGELTGYIERLIEFSTKGPLFQDMEAAKAEFFRPEEHAFEDDRAFERRMSLFFDWYIFDRSLKDGKTPLDLFLENAGGRLSPRDKEIFQGFTKDIHSLFVVLKKTGNFVRVRDLFSGARHVIHEDDNPLIFQEKFLFEGRILPWEGDTHFSGAYCFHPPEVKRLLVRELKKARKAGVLDPGPLLREFFLLSVRWERYRHVPPEKIYGMGLVNLSAKLKYGKKSSSGRVLGWVGRVLRLGRGARAPVPEEGSGGSPRNAAGKGRPAVRPPGPREIIGQHAKKTGHP